jgi:hypothetical protein
MTIAYVREILKPQVRKKKKWTEDDGDEDRAISFAS